MAQSLDPERGGDKHRRALDGRANPMVREREMRWLSALVVLLWVGAPRAACIGCNGKPVPFPDHLVRSIVTRLASDEQVVAGGPEQFDQGEVALVLQTALDGIAAIQRLGCRKP
jgi:hypothetical protein